MISFIWHSGNSKTTQVKNRSAFCPGLGRGRLVDRRKAAWGNFLERWNYSVCWLQWWTRKDVFVKIHKTLHQKIEFIYLIYIWRQNICTQPLKWPKFKRFYNTKCKWEDGALCTALSKNAQSLLDPFSSTEKFRSNLIGSWSVIVEQSHWGDVNYKALCSLLP